MSALLSRRIELVVIGASAGGVEALLTLLPALQPGAGVPVLVVLHLPRERSSRLLELFGPRCLLAVIDVEDKLPLLPNTIYFAPPDYHLLVDSGPSAALSSDEPVHFSRPSIDVLFQSAADLYGPALLGIVLTGANEDGANGLATIARAGGLTVVQSPPTAASAAMPAAALKAAPGSRSLELSRIAALLRELKGAFLPEPSSWSSP